MNFHPLISVIIPHLVGRPITCLESIRAQTYKNVEIIVEEDREGRTPSAPRNRGAARATGELKFFCDDDLTLEPDCLEKLYNALDSDHGAAFAYCDYRRAGAGNGIEQGRTWDPIYLMRRNYISTMSLFRRFYRFDESLVRYVDWDVYLTMAAKGERGVYVPEALFTATFAPGGISLRGPRDRLKNTMILKRKHRIFERKYSIIIPVHDELDHFKRCINSVIKNTVEDFEIIVINDNSSRETADYCESLKDCATVIHNVETMHHTHCTNLGNDFANGDFLIWLNSDTIVTHFWNNKLWETFASLPDASCIGPMTNHSASAQEYFVRGKNWNYSNPDFIQATLNAAGARPPVMAKITGFCLFTSKKRVQEIGCLDYWIPAGGNEADWIIRGMKHGLFPYINTGVFVYHAGGASYKNTNRKPLWETGRQVVLKKHGAKWLNILEKKLYLDLIKEIRALSPSAGTRSAQLSPSPAPLP